jgi:hypothetical protein
MGELVVSTHASSTGYFSSSLLPYEDAPVDGWLWLSYDQLNLRFIEQVEPASGVYGIILIESSAKATNVLITNKNSRSSFHPNGILPLKFKRLDDLSATL